LPLFGADGELSRLLSYVEDRYNHTRTLEVSFEETYRVQGRMGKTENGKLYLRKPGKMRWDYTSPPGKLFITDGKEAFLYTPIGNRAEKMKMKESEDMRAPLAFLLGKLEFEKEFQNFKSSKTPDGHTSITADSRSDRLPYKQVEFVVNSHFQIEKLNVTTYENAILAFTFSGEQMNPKLEDKLFQFKLPPGVNFTDSSVDEAKK
jgi:outer membrane lipoprotein carrier protein